MDRLFTTLMERLPQVRGSQVTLMIAFPSHCPANTAAWEAEGAAASEVEPFVQVSAAQTIESEDRQGRGARFLTSMLSGFAVFAASLAALGIYGVTAYVVAQRERDPLRALRGE